jgi:hypothetical protein
MLDASQDARRSLSIEQTLTCPSCGREFEAELWLIVDAGQQPICSNGSGRASCTSCPVRTAEKGARSMPPCCCYRPEADPPLLFSPASQTSGKQDREHAVQFVGALRQSLARHRMTNGWPIVHELYVL